MLNDALPSFICQWCAQDKGGVVPTGDAYESNYLWPECMHT